MSLEKIVTVFEATHLPLQQQSCHVMSFDELLQLGRHSVSRQALYDPEVEAFERSVDFLQTHGSYTYLCMERSDLIDSSEFKDAWKVPASFQLIR